VNTMSILFLDIDDVLCLNKTYGGCDVILALQGVHPLPDAVFREVFDQGACEVLASVHNAMGSGLQYVISSTWREALDCEQMREVFRRAGLGFVGRALHTRWCTPARPERGRRAEDIAAWLDAWHAGEPFAIVDDAYSGPSLAPALTQPTHPFHGRVVLCDENVGLLQKHADTLLQALRRPVALSKGTEQ
jgi:hypothetical protein